MFRARTKAEFLFKFGALVLGWLAGDALRRGNYPATLMAIAIFHLLFFAYDYLRKVEERL